MGVSGYPRLVSLEKLTKILIFALTGTLLASNFLSETTHRLLIDIGNCYIGNHDLPVLAETQTQIISPTANEIADENKPSGEQRN